MIVPNPDRRSERARQAILDAAVELCSEENYARLTMEGIAKRAGVGKQTIYRWWPSKAAVLLEALNDRAGDTLDFPDTGDIAADLRTQMTQVIRSFTDPMFAACTRALIAAAQSDPTTAESFVEDLLSPRIELCVERLRKAQKDGQLRLDVDPFDVVDMLYAPIYYRLLLRTRPVSMSQLDTILDLTFAGVIPD